MSKNVRIQKENLQKIHSEWLGVLMTVNKKTAAFVGCEKGNLQTMFGPIFSEIFWSSCLKTTELKNRFLIIDIIDIMTLFPIDVILLTWIEPFGAMIQYFHFIIDEVLNAVKQSFIKVECFIVTQRQVCTFYFILTLSKEWAAFQMIHSQVR